MGKLQVKLVFKVGFVLSSKIGEVIYSKYRKEATQNQFLVSFGQERALPYRQQQEDIP
jgi:hypothetical protein